MKKYKIFIFFIAMFFLIVTIVSLQKESDDINENLSKIVKQYGLNDSNARYDKELDLLEIEYYMNTWFYPKNPNEIYALFECMLYFNKKEGFIPSNTTIMVDMGEAGWPTYSIKDEEFFALCEKLDIDVLDYKDEDVRELASLWIDNNFYYRSSIAYNDYRKKYENLLTIHNNQLVNTETKAYFRIVSDQLVFREQYSSGKSNDLTIIDDIDVDNFYFGQWDHDNNFWFYDNYNGLNVIKTELSNNIESKPYIVLEANEIDFSKMPEPFAKAYDIHGNKRDYKNIEVKTIDVADLSKDYEIEDIGEDIDIEKAVRTAEDYLNRTEISNMAVEVLDYGSENIYIVRFFDDDIDVVGGATCVAINKKTGEVLEIYGEE